MHSRTVRQIQKKKGDTTVVEVQTIIIDLRSDEEKIADAQKALIEELNKDRNADWF